MKKIKDNRVKSFITVGIIYIIATIVGIAIYKALKLDYYYSLFIADVLATILVFLFSLILKNASCYDPYWSVQPIVIVVMLLINNEITTPLLLASIAIILWGIRLTANWAYTFKNLNSEDWRYRMLHEKNPKLYPLINFAGIHMVPTIVVYSCVLPVVIMAKSDVKLNAWTYIFYITACLSFVMQGLADVEMHKFRKKNTHTFIRDGLWKYSRHPNYLGEICMWFSIGLLCMSSINGGSILLLIGAVLNLMLFLFISIPMAENHQKSRKLGFDEYKKETRMLLPIYKRSK